MMTPRERERRRIRRAAKNAVLYGITITSFDVIIVGLAVDRPPVWLLVGVYFTRPTRRALERGGVMGKPSLRPEDIVDPSAPWIKADPDRNGWYEVWARYGWGGDHPREQVTTMLWRDGKWDRSDSYSKTAEVVAHLEPMRLPDTAHDPLDETGAVRLAEWVVRSTMREYREALRLELRHPADARKVETRAGLTFFRWASSMRVS